MYITVHLSELHPGPTLTIYTYCILFQFYFQGRVLEKLAQSGDLCLLAKAGTTTTILLAGTVMPVI